MVMRSDVNIFDYHQRKIAIRTLHMNDVGVMVMGGMTKKEAREFLKKIGYSDAKINKVEAGDG